MRHACSGRGSPLARKGYMRLRGAFKLRKTKKNEREGSAPSRGEFRRLAASRHEFSDCLSRRQKTFTSGRAVLVRDHRFND